MSDAPVTDNNFKKAYIPPLAEALFIDEDDLLDATITGRNQGWDDDEAKKSIFFDDDCSDSDIDDSGWENSNTSGE